MKQILLFLFLALVASYFTFGQTQAIEKIVQEGVEFHDKGDFDKAIELYKKALSIDSVSALANYEISMTYLASKEYSKAVLHSQKVLDLNGEHMLGAYITNGSALDMLGNPQQAIEVYEKGLNNYKHHLLFYNLAVTCLNCGEIEKAYDSAINAISIKPNHASSHFILSQIMEKKGSRIQAMLPLYYFLLMETNSERSSMAYNTLKRYMDHGVSRESETNIKVNIPLNLDDDFGPAELMVSLSKASNTLAENEGKPELELFAENNESIFNVLGELKKKKKGFWWNFYVPFFYEIAKKDLTRAFSYYIAQPEGEKAINWLRDNGDEFEKFKNWINK